MASTDDVNSTLQGVVRNLSQWAQSQNAIGSLVLGSTVVVTAIGTTAVSAIGASSGRSVLLFHNPNTSTAVILSPSVDVNGAAINATFSSPGGGYVLLPLDYVSFSGIGCRAPWNVAGQSGTTFLTVASL